MVARRRQPNIRALAGAQAVRRSVRQAILGAALLGVGMHPQPAHADPTPCVAGVCGAAVSSGQASIAISGKTVTVEQRSDTAILNWSNFDIAADGRVIFNQPSSAAVALNRIFQSSPSQILGAIEANGQVYLINQNGFLFGSGARVNVGGLLASSLNITDADFGAGLLAPIRRRDPVLRSDGRSSVLNSNGRPVFGPDGQPLPVMIDIAAGAQITTRAPDQRILLAAQSVSNGGRVSAPDGQVILAAGDTLYLQASRDPKLRGLLVEVNGGGQALNKLTGDLSADRGNVTMLGLAVNQSGRVSATTSTSVNGSVHLLARDSAELAIAEGGEVLITTARSGRLVLGPQSITSVLPDPQDTTTAVDAQPQLPSTLELYGQRVVLQGGSQIVAPGGELSVTAVTGRAAAVGEVAGIHVDRDAHIDLSGSDAIAPVTRNLLSVELRANELADSPLQRDGPLRGSTVVVDARVGTPLANVSGYLGLVRRSVQERTSEGGTAQFHSEGDVVIAEGAMIDVSGGAVTYTPGLMQTSQLIRADGKLVDIGAANPDDQYVAVYNPTFRQAFDRWGVVNLIQAPGIANNDPGYVEGRAAGTLQFQAFNMLLNGTFLGGVTNGAYQRSASRMASGGEFIIGDLADVAGFIAPRINLTNGVTPVTIGNDANLPAGLSLNLPVEFMRSGGFSRIQLASDKGITLPADVDLALAAGGALSLTAPSITVNGSIDIPAGAIALRAADSFLSLANPVPSPGIFVGDGVQMNVSGLWTNDALVPGQTPSGLTLPDAGSITLTQTLPGGVLAIGDSAALRATGGAWLNLNSKLTGGAGGAISIVANTDVSAQGSTLAFGSGLVVEGYGVQGAKGGSFTLQAPRLRIRELADLALPQQTVSANANTGGVLEISSRLFSDAGFAKFRLTADGARLAADPAGNIVTVSGRLDLGTSTLYMDADAASRPTQRGVSGFAAARLPPVELRAASDLQLVAKSNGGVSTFAEVGNMLVFASARIVAAPGSTMAFATSGNLDFNGSILSPAGTIKLSVQSPAFAHDQGFIQGQHLRLGSTATIDVGGIAVLQPNDAGLLRGTVLNGGSVSLTAQRGSVVTLPGSHIDISGTQAQLDLPVTQPAAGWQRSTIASSAGSLSVTAVESASLLGSIEAHGGQGSTGFAAGGSLQVSLSKQTSGFSVRNGTESSYPTAPRTIRLSAGAPTLVDDNTGLAILNPQLLASSGFDSLGLIADDRIELAPGVDVAMAQRLVLQSPVLAITGSGSSRLSAQYIGLGSGLTLSRGGGAQAGAGQLSLQADAVDLTGFLSLRGIRTASISSTGQISLLGDNGRLADDANTNLGGLDIAGDLTLNAARVVPGTGVDFVINAAGGVGNTVRLGQYGTLSGVPLSVAGGVTINADSIEQGGSLLAPFGRISLNAVNNLALLPGSTTSVSASGALLPYGRVDEGSTNSWVYGITAESASPISAVPRRAVSLTAGQVRIDQGATVNVSGGGDLLADLWTPGTGGSRDVLKAGTIPGLYAVVPSLGNAYAPYDPLMYEGSDLRPGDGVYLGGGGGIAAGHYMLLPARYALLPGAFLLQAANGYADIEPGTSVPAASGATIVAGFRSFGNDGIEGGRYQGFLLRPGSYAHQLADYADVRGSSFFADASGDTSLLARTLPADAGALSIQVGDFLDARGIVMAAGAASGRNATISVAAPSLQIDPGVSSTPTAGVAHLSVATLDSWHPGTLLLGGVLNADGKVQVVASTVSVAAGSNLRADELLLTANESIAVQNGATLRTGSAAPPAANFATAVPVRLVGANASGAAVLGLSDLHDLVAERPATSSTVRAVARIASGAAIESHGSILIDAPGGASIADQSVTGTGARWSLGADRVVFGAPAASTNAMAINANLAGRLNQGVALRVSAGTAIDLIDPTTIGAVSGAPRMERISLLSPVVNNLTAGAVSRFDAERIFLGSGSNTSASVAAGSGQLSLTASTMQIGPGTQAYSGFGSVALLASGSVTGIGTGALTSSGDLRIRTAGITTAGGASTTIAAPDGALLLEDAGAAATVNPADIGIGGMLTLSGRTIDSASDIVLPAGVLTMDARDQLQLRTGSTLDVGGITPVFAARGSPGGSIRLRSGGALLVDGGTSLRVTGAPDADAGDIEISAAGTANLAGALIGAASASGAASAAVSIQAGQIANLDALNQRLESSGFARERAYEVTQGDLVLAASSRITARRVQLTADAGALRVQGTIDASGSGERGRIQLAAHDDLQVAGTAVLRANGTSATTRGGSIELTSTQGRVQVGAGATLAAASDDSSGRLVLSALRTTTGSDVQVDLAADVSRFGSVVIAPLLQFSLSAQPTAAQLTTIRNSVTSYMAAAPATIRSRLNLTAAPNVVVRPALDLVQTGGNLNLAALDLTAWRFGGQAADINFRASGSITVAGIISDGFSVTPSSTTSCPNCIELLAGPASGIGFVAGADFTSVRRGATLQSSNADLLFNAGTVVRTGAADILLAAARDINFGTASVYTGGTAAAASSVTSQVRTTYPDADTTVEVLAGRDILANSVNRSIAAWQRRSGATNASWGINFNQFNWSVGVLGGGDLRLRAGRDAINVSAAVADSARVTSGNRQFFGGGDLTVDVGRNLASGYFHVGRGTGRLEAGGAISSARTNTSGAALGSLLGAGDASYFVRARGDVLLEGMIQSSLLVPVGGTTSDVPYFLRYTPDSVLDVSSSGGSVELFSGHLISFIGSGGSAEAISFQPPNIRLAAYSGDVSFTGSPVYAHPSDSGQISIAAARDIRGNDVTVSLLDAGAAVIPTASQPTNASFNAASALTAFGTQASWSAALRHQQDGLPVFVSAGRDIVGGRFELAKSATIQAGRDIVGLRYAGQNLNPDDMTLIRAGRDISYPDNRNSSLAIGQAGPGRMTLLAGRNIDLGVSAGITSFGNIANGNLPDSGADITMLAGLGAPLGVRTEGTEADFLTAVVEPSAAYQSQLVQYVRRLTGAQNLDFAAAVKLFRGLSEADQIPLAGNILVQELVKSGREANTDPALGYTRGFAAIDALFPGSRPTSGESPFNGNLSLAFSRIYSLDGGTVELLVPGGRVDVGLANPPAALTASTGLKRQPSDLGIVAQREGDVFVFARNDILVNQSRVFTLLGGDIALWSSQGNIDAGRGAKSSISAPPPVVVVDDKGNVTLDASASIAGSGIRTIRSSPTVSPGDVDLIAPAGFVNAGDAGIGSAGNLNIAAQQVLGLDNIQVGGVSTGVPPEVGGLGASLSGVTAAAGSSTNAATSGATGEQRSSQQAAPLAQTALSWLEVFVLGLGEDNCNQNDVECLRRQKTTR